MKRFEMEDLDADTERLVKRLEVLAIHHGGAVTWVNHEREVAVVVEVSADPKDGYTDITREMNVDLFNPGEVKDVPFRERVVGLRNGREPMKLLDIEDLAPDARKTVERLEGYVRSEGSSVLFHDPDRGFCALVTVLNERYVVPPFLQLAN